MERDSTALAEQQAEKMVALTVVLTVKAEKTATKAVATTEVALTVGAVASEAEGLEAVCPP